MLELVAIVVRALRSSLRSRGELVIESLALRQQLAVLGRGRRVHLRERDRLFWLWLRQMWSGWSDVLVLVKPETDRAMASRRLSALLGQAVSPRSLR